MKTIAIIHARGGSKRIPLKNIKSLAGRPLIAYPIQLAKAIPQIERIVVSSDHPEILRIAREHGAETPFVRPADISEDVPSELVTLHALKWLKENENYHPEVAVTLTPATPFTRPEQVQAGLNMLAEKSQLDSVVTIRKAREFPQWMVDLQPDGTGKTLLGNSYDGEYNVSQNLKRYYYPLGAFFINRVSSFMTHPSMYGNRWGCIEMDLSAHVDIDDPEDLIEAEKIAKTWMSK